MISVDNLPYPKVKNFLPSKNNVKHFSTLSLYSYCLILRTSLHISYDNWIGHSPQKPVDTKLIENSATRRHHSWEKIGTLNLMKIKSVALNIVKMLPIERNMRDSIWKTSLVMKAEPEEFAETEKGKNRVRSKATCECDTDYHFNSFMLSAFYETRSRQWLTLLFI